MKPVKISAAVGLLAALGAICWFVFLYDPAARAWERTRVQNSIEAYEAFLKQYSASQYSPLAEKGLQTLREEKAWEVVKTEPTINGLAAFKAKYPTSSHANEAYSQLKALLLRAACEQYAGSERGQTTNKSVDEMVSLALVAQTERPSTLDDYQQAIDIWVSFLSQPESEPFRVSFADIQPDPNPETIRLDEVKRAGGMVAGGTISWPTGEKFEIVASIFSPDGRIERGFYTLGKGECLIQDPAPRRRNLTGNIAISPKIPSYYTFRLLAFTELPQEYVYFKHFLGSPEKAPTKATDSEEGIILPNGCGTVIRFKGEVDGFFKGYRFIGDITYPLCFVLLKDAGLTYVGGKGSVISKDGKSLTFPPEP